MRRHSHKNKLAWTPRPRFICTSFKINGHEYVQQDIPARLFTGVKKVVEKKEEKVRYLFITKDDEDRREHSLLKFVNDKQVSFARPDGYTSVDTGERSPESIAARFARTTYLEVRASDLPYLVKPTGEFAEFCEFRKWIVGDSHLSARAVAGGGIKHGDGVDLAPTNSCLSGYRWCKPREVEEVKEKKKIVAELDFSAMELRVLAMMYGRAPIEHHVRATILTCDLDDDGRIVPNTWRSVEPLPKEMFENI